MEKYRLLVALVICVATSSLAQQPGNGIAVGPAGEMAAPNYATKGLERARPSLAPRPDAPSAGITYNVTFAEG